MKALLAGLGIVWVAWLGRAAPPPLALTECYERALAASEAPGMALAEWRAAEARHRQTRAALRPSLGLLLTERLQNERDRGGSVEGESNTTDLSQFDARVRAQHTLFSGFRLTRTADSARAEASALRLDSERLRELLYLDVSDAFHELLLRQRDLEVLAGLAAALGQSVTVLEQRVRIGRSRPADLLRAQTDLAEVRVEEETAKGLRESARELLGFLIGAPGADLVVHEPSPFPAQPELEARLAGLVSRKDVLAEEARLDATRLAAEAAAGERKPQVRAQADGFLLEEPDQQREWSVLLTLDLPLFDSGLIRARVDERRERTRVSELNLAAVRRRAGSEVRAAFIEFLAAAAQRARLGEAIAAARENHRVQEEDYQLGRASQLDALTALAQWHRLQRREAEAEIGARASLVRLHVAAGEGAP